MPIKDPAAHKEYRRQYYQANKAKWTAYRKKHWDERGPEAVREYRTNWSRGYTLRVKHGMTREGYEALLTWQGNCCAICKTDDPGAKKDWRIDHCHTTNRVRGLLCHRCNVALGLVDDSVKTLQTMIDYLNRSRKHD